MNINLIITGRSAAGKAAIVEQTPVLPIEVAALNGLQFFPLWATDGGASVTKDPTRPAMTYWPQKGGSRFLVVTWQPHPQPIPDADSAAADAVFPGLLDAFETDSPGFHTSHSIDYGICLEGEMWLQLDEGDEARITPGTAVVQRSTRHRWENRSDAAATMLFVLIDIDPADA